MAEWNGVRIISHPRSPSAVLWSDASGSFRCGAICMLNIIQMDIAMLGQSQGVSEGGSGQHIMDETYSGLHVWGYSCWQGQRVIVNCDNTGVVAVANSVVPQVAPQIMHLLQYLFFIRALGQFSVHVITYVKGLTTHEPMLRISCNYPILILSQVFKSTYQCTLFQKVSYPWSSLIGHLIVRSNCSGVLYSWFIPGYTKSIQDWYQQIQFLLCITIQICHFC